MAAATALFVEVERRERLRNVVASLLLLVAAALAARLASRWAILPMLARPATGLALLPCLSVRTAFVVRFAWLRCFGRGLVVAHGCSSRETIGNACRVSQFQRDVLAPLCLRTRRVPCRSTCKLRSTLEARGHGTVNATLTTSLDL